MNELCNRSAIELAAMIRAREVSSREVIDAHLDRISEVNPIVNALTVVLSNRLGRLPMPPIAPSRRDHFTVFRSR